MRWCRRARPDHRRIPEPARRTSTRAAVSRRAACPRCNATASGHRTHQFLRRPLGPACCWRKRCANSPAISAPEVLGHEMKFFPRPQREHMRPSTESCCTWRRRLGGIHVEVVVGIVVVRAPSTRPTPGRRAATPPLWPAPAAASRARPPSCSTTVITTERVQEWRRTSRDAATHTIRGIAGSSGVAEGPARVILDVDQLTDVRDGEILVAPFTQPAGRPCSAESQRLSPTPAE